MTDPQTPATEAGRRLWRWPSGVKLEDILAIETEARADALREAAERVRALDRFALLPSIVALPFVGKSDDGPLLDRSAVLAILDPEAAP